MFDIEVRCDCGESERIELRAQVELGGIVVPYIVVRCEACGRKYDLGGSFRPGKVSARVYEEVASKETKGS